MRGSPLPSVRPSAGVLSLLLALVLAVGLTGEGPGSAANGADPIASRAVSASGPAPCSSAGAEAPGLGKVAARRARRGRPGAGFSPGFGIIDLPERALRRDLRGMRRLGARRIRVDLSWARSEPRPGVYRWEDTDRVFRAARAEGLKVLAIVGYEPRWARRYDAAGRRRPPSPTAFARFVDAAARRYAPLVQAWEIWNEPNLERFWSSGPDPAAYAALVDAAAPVLQRRDRSAPVLAGALAPAEDAEDGSEISPPTFLRGYYRAARRKSQVDAISVHPYTYPALPSGKQSWNTFHRLGRLRAVMRAHGQRRQRIWLTEYGAPTGRHPRAVSPARQARMLTQGYRRSRALRYVGPIFFYSYRDQGRAPRSLEANFGVIRHHGRRKASYFALARLLGTAKSRK